jgi:hypothetical protein
VLAPNAAESERAHDSPVAGHPQTIAAGHRPQAVDEASESPEAVYVADRPGRGPRRARYRGAATQATASCRAAAAVALRNSRRDLRAPARARRARSLPTRGWPPRTVRRADQPRRASRRSPCRTWVRRPSRATTQPLTHRRPSMTARAVLSLVRSSCRSRRPLRSRPRICSRLPPRTGTATAQGGEVGHRALDQDGGSVAPYRDRRHLLLRNDKEELTAPATSHTKSGVADPAVCRSPSPQRRAGLFDLAAWAC